MKFKKLTPNQAQFAEEIKRLQRAMRAAERSNIVFDESPIPKMPARVTEKALKKIKEIKPVDIRIKGFDIDTDTGEVKPHQENRKHRLKKVTTDDEIKHPRVSMARYDKLSPEELHKRRQAAGKKAWETRKSKYSPEEFKEILKKQGQKAAETRRKNIEAGITVPKKRKKPVFKKPADELKKIRHEAGKKAWETRQKHEAEKKAFLEAEARRKKQEQEEFIREELSIIDGIRMRLEKAENQATADFLIGCLEDEISYLEDEGYENPEVVIAERVKHIPNAALDLAERVAYDSSQEELRSDAYNLAMLIYGYREIPFSLDELEECIQEDIPYVRRR